MTATEYGASKMDCHARVLIRLRETGSRVQAVSYLLGIVSLLLSVLHFYSWHTLSQTFAFGPRTLPSVTSALLLLVGGFWVIFIGQAISCLCDAIIEQRDSTNRTGN